nr:AAA family ATPase [Aquabacterium sp. A08]
MHSLLFGESGNGKSWMYKKVLEQNLIPYRVANCANASRLKSLTSEIVGALIPSGTAQKTGFTENKEASIKAIVAEGKFTHQGQYKLQLEEPLEDAFAKIRRHIGDGPLVVVLDNLESIFNNSTLMDELADIIILLDDHRYAKYGIKFIIVGVPNGVLEYFAKTKNLESVSNRLEELPKVTGLTLPMVKTLAKTGFNELLKANILPEGIDSIAGHCHHITMGVAQRVQEYFEKLAYQIEDNRGVFQFELLQKADKDWLRLGMRQGYTVVESHLNSKRTSIARRNQVIYCIGKIKSHQIDSGVITEQLKEEFSETISETNMGIGSILAELASGDSPLLKKNPKTNEYRVVDPRYIMCIRIMLRKDPVTGVVEKLSFAS